MRKLLWIGVATILITLAGCRQADAPPPAATASPAAAEEASPKAAPDTTSGQELNQAIQQPLDKARAVEQTLEDAKKATDAAAEREGG